MNHPVQQSLDPAIAPDIELDDIVIQSNQRWLQNASVGPMIHRIVENRGKGRFVTRCGLIAKNCAPRQVPADCPDCWHS